MKRIIFFIVLASFLSSCSNSNSNSNSNSSKAIKAGKFEVGESVLFVSKDSLENGIVQKAEGTNIVLKFGKAGDETVPDFQVYRKSEIAPLDISVLKNSDGKIIEDNSIVFFQNKVMRAEGKWALGKMRYIKEKQFFYACGGNASFMLDERGRMVALDKMAEYQPTTISTPKKETIEQFKKDFPDCLKEK